MSDCWYMCDDVTDRCAENRRSPNEPCTYETLAQLGVHYKRLGDDELAGDTTALGETLVRELGYHAFDLIDINRDVLGGDRLDALAQQHYTEHLHEDDEVRLLLAGRGYFDVRDGDDRWVRVLTQAGDCIVVPAGIYHRFTTAEEHYTTAMRVFEHNPRWIAVPRPAGDALPVRHAYLQRLRAPAQTAVGAAEGVHNGVYSIAHPTQLDEQLTHIVATELQQQQQQQQQQHEHGDVSGKGVDVDGDSNKTRATTHATTAPAPASSPVADVVLVLYVAGAAVPPRGESWCPDCVDAKPAIVEGVALLRAQLPHTRVIFVECPVQRANYRGNAQHVYRTHPLLRIRGVPTVFVLTPASSSSSLSSSPSSSLLWSERLQVVLRTEEPQVTQFAQLASTLQAQQRQKQQGCKKE